MLSAKELRVEPIAAMDANRLVRKMHYSGKVVPNSQVHLGVFWQGSIEGVMSFGPSLKKKGTIKLVEGTRWHGFIELNRMAFSERLPRNSESRAISVAMRLFRKVYPQLEWVVSFADATQCGDGAIYRASGFVLVSVRKNTSLLVNPATGEPMHKMQAYHLNKPNKEVGKWRALQGFQLQYLYFLNPSARERLTVPIIPFHRIAELGASMYRGKARPKQAIPDSNQVAAGQNRPGRSTLCAEE